MHLQQSFTPQVCGSPAEKHIERQTLVYIHYGQKQSKPVKKIKKLRIFA